MRRIFSIFLFLILLFNMIGYRAWFYYAERRLDLEFEARLDEKSYDENELISIAIPLHNPYQLEKNRFERINGEINVDGKTFKYVMRKVFDGTMTLLCIPDHQKTVLKKAQTEMSGNNDLTGTNNSSRNSKQINGSDYTDYLQQYHLPPILRQNVLVFGHSTHSLTDPALASPGQPPEFLS